MKKDELVDSVGIRIVRISCDDAECKITRFSELGENWYLPSECPKCKRYIDFNKTNINKIITCKCGQKICCQVSDELI